MSNEEPSRPGGKTEFEGELFSPTFPFLTSWTSIIVTWPGATANQKKKEERGNKSVKKKGERTNQCFLLLSRKDSSFPNYPLVFFQ